MSSNKFAHRADAIRKPLILFITAATSISGAGHMMRCLTYAKSLRYMGCEVFFDSVIEMPWVKKIVDTEQISWQAKPDVIYDLVILDSYDPILLQQRLDQYSYRKSIQICDSSTPIMGVDGVIWLDPCPPQVVKEGIKPRVLAAGVIYLMQDMLCQKMSLPPKASSVLVVLGGSPSKSVIDEIVKLLDSPKYESVTFHVLSDYIPRATNQKKNFRFYPLGTDMVPLLNFCDTIITSAGTSLWIQFSNLRVMGVVGVVENQRANYLYVVEKDLACGLGFLEQDSLVLDDSSLEKLLFESDYRSQLSLQMNEFVDSRGVEKLATLIRSFVVG